MGMATNKRLSVLITGASSGIGAGLACEYARLGARVTLAARRLERLQEVAARVDELGGEALAVACDVTDRSQLDEAVSAAVERFGGLDHVVANSGFGVAGAVHKLDVEDFKRQFDTNVFGVLRTYYASREALVESRGCFAIVGSVNGYTPLPGVAAYCMSKHAVHGLAGALRHELSPRGVAVVLLVPGFVDSEIRQVDNDGVYHQQAGDPIPMWLSMRTPIAARKMVRAIKRRRKEAVITAHGKILVLLQRHTPWVLDFLIHRFKVVGRRAPSRQGAGS